MIIFEISTYTTDTGEKRDRFLYWLGCTTVAGSDSKHEPEIYEQLDAELIFNL